MENVNTNHLLLNPVANQETHTQANANNVKMASLLKRVNVYKKELSVV